MSEIRVTNVIGEDGSSPVNFTQGINMSGIVTATAFIPSHGQLSHRNLIINGAMNVSQRGTSFTSLGTAYTVDRFRYTENIDTGVVTVTQESITDLPGFTKAAKINCTTAEAGVPSKSGSKFAAFNTKLEGQDLQQLAYGTSSAKQITLSFYVKSNVTGTFCVSLYKGDQTARNVSLGYTINSANTWEKKTLTFPADTGGGGIDNDNGSGLEIYWVVARQQGYQGTASTTWGNNTDARFANLCTATIFENTNDHIMFTGIQLEVGAVATPFEHKKFSEELARCQRYCFRLGGSIGGNADVYTCLCFGIHSNATQYKGHVQHPVPMRSKDVTFTASNITLDDDVASYNAGNFSSIDNSQTTSSSDNSTVIMNTSNYGAGAGRVSRVLVSVAGGYLQGECEL
mgnify:CR=1 FL=1|tara:strand:- start:1644 stop:2843 length:1200 start_codon:yes stop_codon:yes gene_type:complete